MKRIIEHVRTENSTYVYAMENGIIESKNEISFIRMITVVHNIEYQTNDGKANF